MPLLYGLPELNVTLSLKSPNIRDKGFLYWLDDVYFYNVFMKFNNNNKKYNT